MQKIMVPVDFSPESMVAAEVAIQMASIYQASVGLINVVEAPVYAEGTMMVDNLDDLVSFAMGKMSEVKKVLLAYADTYNVELYTQIEVGFIADVISNLSKKENCDLIVMSTHGASGIKKALLGSVASSIIDKVSCNMLIVPSHMESSQILDVKDILFAVDYSKTNNWGFVEAKALAEKLKARLNCVHINEDENFPEDEVLFKEFLDANDATVDIQFKAINGYHANVDIVDELEAYAIKHGIGLMVLVHHEKSLFKRLFSKSISKELTLHSKLPVLIFQEN